MTINDKGILGRVEKKFQSGCIFLRRNDLYMTFNKDNNKSFIISYYSVHRHKSFTTKIINHVKIYTRFTKLFLRVLFWHLNHGFHRK